MPALKTPLVIVAALLFALAFLAAVVPAMPGYSAFMALGLTLWAASGVVG